jgi:polyhydroxyalkanoate synthesis regulator phasin
MSNLLKELAMMLYSAGEEVEKKAAEYREKRDERAKKFEDTIRENLDKADSFLDEEGKKMKKRINELADKIGIASKNEIDELKKQINDLAAKIDGMSSK